MADRLSVPRPCPHLFHFSFQCCGAPPDLHSFPTRRSSDLGQRRLDRLAQLGDLRIGQGAVRRPELQPRSEEHTSELQSHHDLVCRLLLEKKKPKAEGGSDRVTETTTRPRPPAASSRPAGLA